MQKQIRRPETGQVRWGNESVLLVGFEQDQQFSRAAFKLQGGQPQSPMNVLRPGGSLMQFTINLCEIPGFSERPKPASGRGIAFGQCWTAAVVGSCVYPSPSTPTAPPDRVQPLIEDALVATPPTASLSTPVDLSQAVFSDSRVYTQTLQRPESIEVHADSDSSVLVDSYPNVPILNDPNRPS